MKRRILSMLLLVVMLISLFPVQAFAEDTQADNSAVPADVENGEPQQTEEAAQPDDIIPGEEVEIPAMPEPEYENPTEEEPALNPETPAEPEDETETEPEAEAADGESDDAEKVSIRFNLTPEDLTLKVYSAEAQDAEPVSPEEDGSYLLIPGEYYYDAERDGYIPVLAASFTVTESAVIDVTLEEDSVSSVMGDEVASSGYPKTGNCGDDLTWSLDSAGNLTISGNGTMTDYYSDAPWKNYSGNIKAVEIGTDVTSIGEYAFASCTNLTSVTIGSSVLSIGKAAFINCTALTSVTIPGNVTSIGGGAFSTCSRLTSVTICNGVTSIDTFAFFYCKSLTSVTIPESVTTIGQCAFDDTALKHVYYLGTIEKWNSLKAAVSSENDPLLNAALHYIVASGTSGTTVWSLDSDGKLTISGTGAMADYTSADSVPWYKYKANIKTVEIGSGVTSIGNYAFYSCGQLISVTIGTGVTCVGEDAFGDCGSLESVTIPNGVKTIGKYAFENCSSLKSVTIGSGVESIGEYAFYSCKVLGEITIPNSVKSVGNYAFGLCKGLKNAAIGTGMTGIGEGVFYLCEALEGISIPNNVKSIGIKAFYSCKILKNVTIGNSVTSIGDNAFKGTALTTVKIPGSVTSIGEYAFYECAALTSAIIDNSAANSAAEIGNFAFGNCSLLAYLSLGSSVTSIGEGAFNGCAALTAVTIPNSVKSIGDSAFKGTALTAVTVPGRVTSIGSNAFYGCAVLTNVTIPDSVTSIGQCAFLGAGLKDVYYLGTPEKWNNLKLSGISNGNDTLLNAKLHCIVASGSCGAALTYMLDSNGKLTISGKGAMGNYSESNPAPWSENKANIKTAEIGSGVTSIGACAFNGCAALADITIPVTVTEIKDNAFQGCNNLKNVYYSGDIKQWSSIKIASSGNESLDNANKHCADLPVTLDREYITMKAGDTSTSVKATVTAAEWKDSLKWTVESESEGIISIDFSANECKITPLKKGTAYVVAKVEINGVINTARCRVDVTEKSAEKEITGVQLGAAAVTSELYSRDYAEFDIVLLLPQNLPDSSLAGSGSVTNTDDDDEPADNGVAIKSAEFEDEAVSGKFDLVVVDDGRLAVVPRDEYAKDTGKAKEVKNSYTSKVNVYVEGRTEPYTTDTKLKLTVKKTQPKLKASVASFNSFYSGQSNTIEITGAIATEIKLGASKKVSAFIPAWLEYLGERELRLTDAAPKKNASGTVYLEVNTEEWAIPAYVTLSVKNTYKAPKLKLSASSVKFNSVSSKGVELQLLPTVKGETLEGLNVKGIVSSTEDFKVADDSFNVSTGKFTLKKDSKVAESGKVTLTVSFGGTTTTVDLTLSAQIITPTIKLKKSSVTLNPAYNDSATVDMVITPADFEITGKNVTIEKPDGITAKVSEDGKLTVSALNGKLDYNKTYKVTVSIPNTKAKAVLTIKTCKEGLKPSVTLKTSGAIDLTYPDRAVVITPTIKNYSGVFPDYKATVTITKKGETPITYDLGAYFDIDPNGNVLSLTKRDGFELDIGSTYTATITYYIEKYNDNNDNKVVATVRIPVKQTAVNLKLSKSSISLNKLYEDSAEIDVTCLTKNYKLEKGKVDVIVMDKTGNESAAGRLFAEYLDGGKLRVSTYPSTKPGETYKVFISAEKGNKQHTLTVTIPKDEKASTITATLKAKGSIDVIRGNTEITFTSAYKNILRDPRSEKVEIYKIDGKGETLVTIVNLKDGLKNFNADPTCKYKAKLVADFERGSGYEIESALIPITVKTGTAKVKATGTPTLYLKDKNSRGKFTLTSTDLTLNGIAKAEIKDQKYKDMFELYNYGNGQFAIGFKDNKVSAAAAKLKSATVTLNVWHTGNNTAKPDSTVSVKVTLVK